MTEPSIPLALTLHGASALTPTTTGNTPRNSFDRLPREVQARIFSYFDPVHQPVDRTALARCLRVFKHHTELIANRLYHTLAIVWFYRIPRFSMDLPTEVMDICADNRYTHQNGPAPLLRFTSPANAARCRRLIVGSRQPGFRHGDEDRLLFPNMDTLHLVCGYDSESERDDCEVHLNADKRTNIDHCCQCRLLAQWSPSTFIVDLQQLGEAGVVLSLMGRAREQTRIGCLLPSVKTIIFRPWYPLPVDGGWMGDAHLPTTLANTLTRIVILYQPGGGLTSPFPYSFTHYDPGDPANPGKWRQTVREGLIEDLSGLPLGLGWAITPPPHNFKLEIVGTEHLLPLFSDSPTTRSPEDISDATDQLQDEVIETMQTEFDDHLRWTRRITRSEQSNGPPANPLQVRNVVQFSTLREYARNLKGDMKTAITDATWRMLEEAGSETLAMRLPGE